MIKIQDLAFSYGKNEVLKNISMDLEPGRIYGLLGENGVGKTTLLTLLCGLKKTQGGTITTDGRNPWNREPALLQDQYYLPDEVAPVNDKAIAWAKAAGKFWPNFKLDRFDTILREFEVDPAQKMNAMSAGQLKKSYIAFALACNTRYLFLDEPTNGLDIEATVEVRELILRLSREKGVTFLVASHLASEIEKMCTHVLVLHEGEMLSFDTKEEALRLHPSLEDYFLAKVRDKKGSVVL